MTPRDHRFQNVLTDLRRQIAASFSPGEKLPSRSELALLHGVSPSTVQRAMNALAREGSIEIKPRAGWMRAPAPQTPARPVARRPLTIGILTPKSREEWSRNALYGLLLEGALARGMVVREVPHRFEGHQRSTPGRRRVELSRVPWNTFDVALLVDGEDTIKPGAPFLRGRPVLAIDLDATAYGIDSVMFADAEAGAIAARHLLQLGHRYFAVTEEANAYGFAWDPAWTRRRHGFEVAIGEAGGVLNNRWRLPIPRQGGKPRHEHFVNEELPAVVRAWMAEPPGRRPSAFFSLCTGTLELVLREMAKHGLRVPRDMSIISATWNGRNWDGAAPVFEGLRLTSVDLNLTELVRRVFTAVEELVARPGEATRDSGGAPRRFSAPATLLPGESTAAPSA